MFNIYCYYDRVAGQYGEPFLALKDELAFRKFNYTMQNAPMVAQDMELYALGTFDSETGEIKLIDKPMFLLKFEVKN